MPSLFISCVSNEFANYRDAVRRDLSRPNLDTKIQEDFIAYGGARKPTPKNTNGASFCSGKCFNLEVEDQ